MKSTSWISLLIWKTQWQRASTETCSCSCEVLQQYLSRLPLQEGHFGQQAVAAAGLRLQVITHSSVQVHRFLQLLVRLVQQTCRRDPDVARGSRFRVWSKTHRDSSGAEATHLSGARSVQLGRPLRHLELACKRAWQLGGCWGCHPDRSDICFGDRGSSLSVSTVVDKKISIVLDRCWSFYQENNSIRMPNSGAKNIFSWITICIPLVLTSQSNKWFHMPFYFRNLHVIYSYVWLSTCLWPQSQIRLDYLRLYYPHFSPPVPALPSLNRTPEAKRSSAGRTAPPGS